MKMIQALLGVGALSLSGAVLGDNTAHGQDFPKTSADAQLSITQGFEQSSLPLLHRMATSDPDAVSAGLVEKLCPPPCPPLGRRTPGNMLEVTSSYWSLQILGDGTAARFQDLKVRKR